MWRGIGFTSAEQAFAFAKTFFVKDNTPKRIAGVDVTEAEYFQDLIMKSDGPGEAKRRGREATINVAEWDKHKVTYMREIVHAKFMTAKGIVGPLINTGAAMLIEGNDWGDMFWGRCLVDGRWKGLNILGSILMEERGWWNRETK